MPVVAPKIRFVSLTSNLIHCPIYAERRLLDSLSKQALVSPSEAIGSRPAPVNGEVYHCLKCDSMASEVNFLLIADIGTSS